LVRATINSEKHIHPRSLVTIDSGSNDAFVIATAMQNPDSSNQVRVGCTIKAVYVELWFIGSGSQPVVQTSSFEKLVAGQDAMTQIQSVTMHDYPNKKNLFKISQGTIGDANTNTTPVWREWIAIPKGKQRMGLGDSFRLNIAALGEASNDLEVCGIFVFKEYY